MEETIGKIPDADRGSGWTIRNRARGGKYEIVCFRCGITSHMEFECLEKDGRKLEGRKHIVEA